MGAMTGEEAKRGEVRMTVGEHLEELRRRVIRALLYLGLALIVCLVFFEHIRDFILAQPLKALRGAPGSEDAKLLVTGTVEGFFVYLKIGLVAALILASPLMAREIWGFIAAGLYPHEKKHVRVFAPLSYLLFLGGVAFLYYLVLPTALDFLYNFGLDTDKTKMFPSYTQYVSFYITMSLVMGVVFQLPLVMLFFIATGIITPAFFRKYRRHFIVGAVAALAVLTPTGDAMTLLLVSLPVVALYESGLLLGRFFVKGEKSGGASE
jgi:sec-independent protein translocase protein TatC